MRYRAAGSIALALACVALAACSGDEPAPERTACTVVLGAMGDLTPDTGTGIDMFRGVELAVEEARSRGRVDCDIELQIEDTRGDPELAADHARSMVKNDDLVACLCGYTNEEALAAAPAMSAANILISGPAPADEIPEQGFATWFGAAPTTDTEATATLEYINGLGAIDGLAVIDDGSDLGATLADRIASPLGALVKQRLSTAEDDVAEALKDSTVPLVYIGAEGTAAAEIAGELRAAGAQATVIASSSALGTAPPGRIKDGYQVVCPCIDPGVLPAGEDFAQAYGDAYEAPPGPFAAEMYDVTNHVLEALEQAELPADPVALRGAIIDHFASAEGAEGITGTLEWNPTGALAVTPEKDVWVFDWQGSAGAYIGLGPVGDLR